MSKEYSSEDLATRAFVLGIAGVVAFVVIVFAFIIL